MVEWLTANGKRPGSTETCTLRIKRGEQYLRWGFSNCSQIPLYSGKVSSQSRGSAHRQKETKPKFGGRNTDSEREAEEDVEKTASLKTRRAAPMGVRSKVRWKERAVDRTGQNQQGMVTHSQKELGQRLTILIKKKKSSIFRWEGFYCLYVTPQMYRELVKKAVSIFILLLKTRDSHTKFS